MNRRNQILAGILFLQLVVTAVVLWPRPAASRGVGARLLPNIEAAQVARLTITSGDGQSIQLSKGYDGWVLPDAGDYPAQEDTVSTLLTNIAAMESDRPVTQTSSSHKRLKVAEEDFERRIDLELDDGTGHRLYVGTSPSFRVTHVRVDGQDEVYLVSELSAQDASVQATAWVDRVYFAVPQEQVVSIYLENAACRAPDCRLEFEREGDTWTMKDLATGETVDQDAVGALLRQATSVTMLQPLGKDEETGYGMQDPSAVVTLETHSDEAEEQSYTLWIGSQDPADSSYVVHSSESPYYVRVSEFAISSFVEKDRDGFLELPPTPTPQSEATPEG